MKRTSNLIMQKTNNPIIQFIRYGLVSVTALFVDFGTMVLLTELFNVNYIISATIGFIFGLIINYALSVKWVFDKSRFSQKTEIIIFSAIGFIGLGLNDLILWLLTDEFGVYYIISKVGATGVTFVWNFVARKLILFSDNKEKEAKSE